MSHKPSTIILTNLKIGIYSFRIVVTFVYQNKIRYIFKEMFQGNIIGVTNINFSKERRSQIQVYIQRTASAHHSFF